MTIKQAVFVVYESPNGRDNWRPLQAADVPEWVKHPDIMGKLATGQQCMDAAQGDKGSKWYRAERVLTPDEQRAEEKRERKASTLRARRLVVEATQNARMLTH